MLRLGMIGGGSHGYEHAERLLREPRARLVAVADPSERALAALGGLYGDGEQPARFPDHAAMLAAADLDGVIVASPHALHFRQAMDALAAGCHLLIDKPMVLTSAEARKLVDRARLADRRVLVELTGLFSPEFHQARRLVERGAIGTVCLVNGVCAQPWLRHTRGTWRTAPAISGGGNLVDSGSHMLAAMLYLSGQSPEEVFAFIDRRGEEVDIVAAIVLRFREGALGTASVNADVPVMEEGVHISGTDGAISASIYGERVRCWAGDRPVELDAPPKRQSPEEGFVSAVLDGTDVPATAELGLLLAQLTESIYASARRGGAVNIP